MQTQICIIETNVPVRPSKPVIPLNQMDVRSSYVVPYDGYTSSEKFIFSTRIQGRVQYYAKRNGKRFSCAQEREGVRVTRWR